jgi:c-di-GMP-related signal transduction protein
MEIFVARQPIFTLQQEVCAYELLYRSSNQNQFSHIDGNQATTDVINSFLEIGVEELSEGKPCFINFTELIILKELSQFEPNINIITEIIEADLSLSYKLLKLINSPIIGRVYKIKSIKQAIVLLGLKELRKWIFLLSFRETVKNNNHEAVKMCFTRAKASELISLNLEKGSESSSCFLVGMFSLIDTLMKQPIEKIMNQLPLEQEIKETILGHQTLYSDVYDLVVGMERAQWDEIDRLTEIMGMEKQKLFQIYKEAMKWTREIMADTTKQIA